MNKAATPSNKKLNKLDKSAPENPKSKFQKVDSSKIMNVGDSVMLSAQSFDDPTPDSKKVISESHSGIESSFNIQEESFSEGELFEFVG